MKSKPSTFIPLVSQDVTKAFVHLDYALNIIVAMHTTFCKALSLRALVLSVSQLFLRKRKLDLKSFSLIPQGRKQLREEEITKHFCGHTLMGLLLLQLNQIKSVSQLIHQENTANFSHGISKVLQKIWHKCPSTVPTVK